MILQILIVSVLGASLCYYLFWSKHKHGIKGPAGLPLVGNMFDMDVYAPHLSCMAFQKKYGNIFKLKLFGKDIVVVSSYELIHEVLLGRGHDFRDRPNTYRGHLFTGGNDFIFVNWSEHFKWRRSIMQMCIKQHGTGMDQIEHTLQTMCNTFISTLNCKVNQTFEMTGELSNVLNDILEQLILGKVINDKTIRNEATKTLLELVRAFGWGGPGEYLDTFPWVRFFGNSAYKSIIKASILQKKVLKSWRGIVKQNATSSKGSILYEFMNLSDKLKEKGKLDDDAVDGLIWHVYLAGLATSLNSLAHLVHVLIHHPEIQHALQKEVRSVTGDGKVYLNQRNQMPLHQATLFEMSRLTTITAFLVPRVAERDTKIQNTPIKKGTEIWCNAWHLHHDETFWPDPYKFDPNRFLDKDGGVVLADHPNRLHLLPFGAGPRVCLAEVFAQTRMFMIFANLMKNFNLLPETSLEEHPSYDPRNLKFGSTSEAIPYRMRISRLESE